MISRDYFTANGCWGTLFCDITTGNVIHYKRGSRWKKPGDGYDHIVRLDVDEWRKYYPGEDIALDHDVLDFGSWDADWVYEGPETDWREEFRRNREQDKETGGSRD
jgi:hypothetical protein